MFHNVTGLHVKVILGPMMMMCVCLCMLMYIDADGVRGPPFLLTTFA